MICEEYLKEMWLELANDRGYHPIRESSTAYFQLTPY